MKMMLNNIKKSLTFLLISFLLFSCSKDQSYDKKNAVSAFTVDDSLLVSSKKIETQIEIQKTVDSWNFGKNFHQNGRVGNFKKDFTYKNNKIVLKKIGKITIDFSIFGSSGRVFSPVVIKDKIFFLDNLGFLTAYDLDKEHKIWKARLFKPSLFNYFDNPKIFADGDLIFASIGNNKVKALNIKDGSLIWSADLPSLLISKPIAQDDMVFILSDDNKLYSLDAKTGKVLWSHLGISNNMAIYGASDPVIIADKVFVSYSSGEIYALNKNDGSEIWSYDLNINKAVGSNFYLNDIDATPVVRSGRIYVVGNGGLMMAINIQNGDVIWEKKISSIVDFHVSGNFIYIINNENKLAALSIGDGSVKWIIQLPDYNNIKKPHTKIIYNSVIMAGGFLIVNSVDGKLLIISPKNGKILKKSNISGSNFHSPIIINNKIYFYSQGFFSRYLVYYK